jgi:hypothetical protein
VGGNDTRQQWHPHAFGGLYWPAGEQPDNLESWVAGYGLLGYQPCDSPLFEEGLEKLAIYTDAFGPSHVARQCANGYWTSKMGKMEDIEHTLAGLENGKYGRVAVILVRRRSVQHELPFAREFQL